MTVITTRLPARGLHLDFLSYAAAKFACRHWHYSRTMPVGKTCRIGVWEDGLFVGALVFAPGAAGVGLIGPSLGMDTKQVCELQRVALSKHRTPVSRIIAVAIRIVRRTFPRMRLIVSYADPGEGHHGGIYQAGGWIYTGETAATPMWRDRQGRIWHDRNVTPSGFSRHKGKLSRCVKKSDCTRIDRPPKHRYFFPLDQEVRELVQERSMPYPKRERRRELPGQLRLFAAE